MVSPTHNFKQHGRSNFADPMADPTVLEHFEAYLDGDCDQPHVCEHISHMVRSSHDLARQVEMHHTLHDLPDDFWNHHHEHPHH